MLYFYFSEKEGPDCIRYSYYVWVLRIRYEPAQFWFWGYASNPLSCWLVFLSNLSHCWFAFPLNPSCWSVICVKGAEEVINTLGLFWYSEYGLSSSARIECFSVLHYIIYHKLLTRCSSPLNS